MHRLILQAIGKRYGRLRALQGVEAQVESGEVLVVAGRNGSGKSTLLRIIAGLTRPSSGTVVLYENGRILSPEERRSRIGLVAVDVALYGELTARENLAFFARVRGQTLLPKEALRLLAEVGLAGREDDLVLTYSSGMRQRLKYACALLHRPPVLLLDEPGANLDASGTEMVERILAQQRQRGLVVLATNDPREVAWGDRVVRLGEETL
ncbi:MAG: heme ABC exporter ATP-binding protein CcmA [Chloroflexia bacterium]